MAEFLQNLIRRLVLALLVTALPLLALVTVAVTASAPPAAASATPTPAYWLVASDGGIFSFGGAPYYGSTGGTVLNKPVVGMAATSDGGGYYLVASDGGVFSYGDAVFYGSTGSIAPQPARGRHGGRARRRRLLAGRLRRRHLQLRRRHVLRQHRQHPPQPAGGRHGGHARAATATGWWPPTAASSATAMPSFHGSTGSLVLNKPIVGMITGPAGAGYFLVASDGGIFSFGTAPFYGSLGGLPLKHPIVAAAATPTGNGYWFTDTAGLVSNFGSANYYGSAPSTLFRPDRRAWPRRPATGAFVGGTYPSGSYGYDISNVPVRRACRAGDHQIGIVQVDGTLRRATPTRAWRRSWPGPAAGSTSTPT